jgi:hypothetical protein
MKKMFEPLKLRMIQLTFHGERPQRPRIEISRADLPFPSGSIHGDIAANHLRGALICWPERNLATRLRETELVDH